LASKESIDVSKTMVFPGGNKLEKDEGSRDRRFSDKRGRSSL
jgi:hypothetical protein